MDKGQNFICLLGTISIIVLEGLFVFFIVNLASKLLLKEDYEIFFDKTEKFSFYYVYLYLISIGVIITCIRPIVEYSKL